jgi:hypothetical protein
LDAVVSDTKIYLLVEAGAFNLDGSALDLDEAIVLNVDLAQLLGLFILELFS